MKVRYISALVTPFRPSLSLEGFVEPQIDFESLEKLIAHQLEFGVEGFVVCGTTGESPTLSKSEVEKLFLFIKERVPKGFSLILGVGSNSTKTVVENIKYFDSLEPEAYLVVAPYYNKPTQEGIRAHYKAIAGSTRRDIVLYDVPGRTIVDIHVETTAYLAKNVENIIAIKDASGDMEKHRRLKEALDFRPDFLFLSGDDGSAVEYIKRGGHGVVSVLSQVLPSEFKKCLFEKGDFNPFVSLCGLLFKEPNPVPVKEALKLMKVIQSSDVRLPLVPATKELSEGLGRELHQLGVFGHD